MKKGQVKPLSFQIEYLLICFSSLNNAELPLSDYDKKGSWHLQQINQPRHTVFTSGTSHMTDHPQNSYLKPVRQIRDKREQSVQSERSSWEAFACREEGAYAERWKPRCKALQTLLSLGHISFYLLYAPPCRWLWWGYAPENVFCDLHPLIRVGDAAPCGQLDRSEQWASADLWYDRKKNTLQAINIYL